MPRVESLYLRFSLLVAASAAGLAGLLSACDSVSPQIASDIFAEGGALPPELESLANPKPQSQFLASYIEHKDPKGRVKVAVIDCGTDYMHPQLAGQIAFDLENGAIVGAGLDLMGQDRWAHPNLISPLPYAFVAGSLEGSRLKGVEGDPIQTIMNIQSEFNTRLLSAIRANPALPTSLFGKKVTESTFSIFGAMKTLETYSDGVPASYATLKSRGLLISESSSSRPEVLGHYGKELVEAIVHSNWVGSERDGSPEKLSYILSAVEGADAFLPILKDSFQAIEEKYHVRDRVKRFVAYKKILQPVSFSTSDTEDLNAIWHRIQFHYSSVDPAYQFAANFCKAVPESIKSQLQQADLTDEARVRIARAEYARELALIGRIYDLYKTLGVRESQETMAVQDTLSKLPQVFDETFQKPLFAKLLRCGPELADMTLRDPELIQYGEKRFHPYLAPNSAETSHGTHVAGIIARQSPQVDVFPIRVITSTTSYLPEVAQGIRREFEEGFARWASRPETIKAVGLMTPQVYGPGAQPPGQAELAAEMARYLDEKFVSNYLEYYFFRQIIQAIEEVGRRRIKIANMSLGTSFEKSVVQTGDAGRTDRVRNFMAFLTYEYFKFQVAQTIERSARNTLFVIAAGNDGKWLDGRSRSGLPCDLSSSIFKRAQEGAPAESIVPNNRVSNIVCVGSIDANDELSSYTNLPLTSVPFVLSYGESILSTVALEDCEGSNQEVQETYGKLEALGPSIEDDDGRYDGPLTDLGLLDPSSDPATRDLNRLKATLQVQTLGALLSTQLEGAVVQKRCLETHLSLARMSGTSMATPAVAGFLAASLSRELAQKGLTSEQAYELPQYSPKSLIQMMKDKNPVFGGESILKDVTKVTEIKNWNRKAKQDLTRVLGVIKPAEMLQSLR